VRDFVMSVLVLQDVVAIVLVAVISALAAGHALSGSSVASMVGRLLALLVAALVAGLVMIPALIRRVIKTRSRELLVVVCCGVCFGSALLAKQLGYSVALGAFLAGVLVAESGEGHRVEVLLRPLRDLFGAIFFVAVGMTVNPAVVWAQLGTSALATLLVLIAPLLSVSLSGVLLGNGLRRSVTAALSLGQVGEFGFIIAAIDTQGERDAAGLDSIIVTVAVFSAFTTPIAVRHADRIVRAIERVLPVRARDLLQLYEDWFARLRSPNHTSPHAPLRRTGVVIGLDGLATSAVLVGAAAWADPLRGLLTTRLGLEAPWDQLALSLGTVLLVALPAAGFLRATRLFGRQVAERVLAAKDGVGAQLLIASVQLVLLLGIGVPCAVLVLPFAGPRVMAVLAAAVAVLIVVIWRSAGTYTKARHSAERLMDFLEERSAGDAMRASEPADALGITLAVALEPDAYAAGKTLAEIDLRAATGATAVALRSKSTAYHVPSGREVLQPGDVIAVAGPPSAIALARSLLQHGPSAPPQAEVS
jgi:CPA2 family monovalent cation:H+ antiporter-2